MTAPGEGWARTGSQESATGLSYRFISCFSKNTKIGRGGPGGNPAKSENVPSIYISRIEIYQKKVRNLTMQHFVTNSNYSCKNHINNQILYIYVR